MYLSQIDRRYINQRNMNPESFFENVTEANDLSAFIDSTDREILNENRVWSAFTHSFKTQWLTTAKEFDFINDKVKFLNYVNTKFEEEQPENNNKKRKNRNNNDNQ